MLVSSSRKAARRKGGNEPDSETFESERKGFELLEAPVEGRLFRHECRQRLLLFS